MSYEKDMKATWDEYATRMTIEHDRKEAFEKGREQGLEQAKKQWKEEGKEEGKKEGKEEKSTEIVKNLLSARKFSVEEIANFANVPVAFVLKLKKDMK